MACLRKKVTIFAEHLNMQLPVHFMEAVVWESMELSTFVLLLNWPIMKTDVLYVFFTVLRIESHKTEQKQLKSVLKCWF